MIKYKAKLKNSPNLFDDIGDLMRHKMDEYISLTLLTDGGNITKSSKTNVWPIISQVHDLPPVLRKTISNVVLLGI